MFKTAHDQLARVNRAIAEFESMPLTKRNRYMALLHALYDQRRDLLENTRTPVDPRPVSKSSA
jgi:hypothetical protein